MVAGGDCVVAAGVAGVPEVRDLTPYIEGSSQPFGFDLTADDVSLTFKMAPPDPVQPPDPVMPAVEIVADNTGNTFKMKVDPTQRWNWPQNVFYGVLLRIYYEPAKTSRAARVAGVTPGATLSEEQALWLDAPASGAIDRVEYVGLFEDVNWEGDGIYRQWHYHYHKGQIRNHSMY